MELSAHVKKLGNPLREIRERALQIIRAKLRLGFELEDELSGVRELIEGLLAWFHVQQPSMQKDALELLIFVIKTKTGTYIAKEFGVKNLISSLSSVNHKIDKNALEVYEDIMETLRFLNTLDSESNFNNIPRLRLQHSSSESSRESNNDNKSDFVLYPNVPTSNETSESSEGGNTRSKMRNKSDGIIVMLFPWAELCSSDSKTLILVEDALKLLKSTKRSCTFIRDVLLRDFPTEIFLNRPAIIQNLLILADGSSGGRPSSSEALKVLLHITKALRSRLVQLSSLELIHDANRIQHDDNDEVNDHVNLNLEQLAESGAIHPSQDNLVGLRQLPAPIYALDTMQMIVNIMARSVAVTDSEHNRETLELTDLTTCVCLVESLTLLLCECVHTRFWCVEHSTHTHRDISHKSCVVMRVLGDIIDKYRKSFTEDPERLHHRVAWIRLVDCGERLLYWSRGSAVQPSSLVAALQLALLDPGLDMLYPKLSERVSASLHSTKASKDQEFKTKCSQLQRVCVSMEDAVRFMKKTVSRSEKQILTCIKNSLLALELHSSEVFVTDVAEILLNNTKYMDLSDTEWNEARSIALSLMAHKLDWVQIKMYAAMADMVKTVLASDEQNQKENEKCLTLLCDVSVLTEICCQGLASKSKEVEMYASEIMLYLLRGRIVLSEGCWWRLLASLLPVLPLLHVYAAHETQLGQAICKSLERDIAECMGVPTTEVMWGLVRLLYVKCTRVRLDAAHDICLLLGDDKYLPPKETMRSDVLLSALNRVEPQDFNVDNSSSPLKTAQTTGLFQILDVLKQDIVLEEFGTEYVCGSNTRPTLEPTLRRSALQQLALTMRQRDVHDTFLQSNGLQLVVATLRLSLMIDDYLAFPECAISCVSVLNSIGFGSRHALLKIPDLPSLLVRVILVFPANDTAVTLSSQVLSLTAWAGFVLQELDSNRQKVPALPQSVTERTCLPFSVNSYWSTSPNAEHSSIDWLISDPSFLASLRVRWWCAWDGLARVLRGASPPPAPACLRATARDVAALQSACPLYECSKALVALENATSHKQVNHLLSLLESYIYLLAFCVASASETARLPWQHVRRFLLAAPASPRDAALLTSLLQLTVCYMDNVATTHDPALSWVQSSFFGSEASVVALLSRDQFFTQQTPQESIEITQMHVHIVRVLLRWVVKMEDVGVDNSHLESLVKILLACLEKFDLNNFHMLGYLNEVMRCIRHSVNSRYCKLSQETLLQCVKRITSTLTACGSNGTYKGRACKLDALLALLALCKRIHVESIPVQQWIECFSNEVTHAIVSCTKSSCPQLKAAALHVMAALVLYAQLLPLLIAAIEEDNICELAVRTLCLLSEANAVRTAATSLLTAVTSRASAHATALENDVLNSLQRNRFVENCIELLTDFCSEQQYDFVIEPNVPLSVLERRSELEVRAQKSGSIRVSPCLASLRRRIPPTASLVVELANTLHNISALARCPVQQWNDQGLYRLLFRCLSWSNGSEEEVSQVVTSVCRALLAATQHKSVRVTLSANQDCLSALFTVTTTARAGLDSEECTTSDIASRTQALLLTASFLTERTASHYFWQDMKEHPDKCFRFFMMTLHCVGSDESDLQTAALHCLTQVAQSAAHKTYPDKTKDITCIELIDNIKFVEEDRSNRYDAGDNECSPEYLVEELAVVLIDLYVKITERIRFQAAEDEQWIRVCSCLSSVLSISARCRLYSLHRGLHTVLLGSLQILRDRLSLQGKPADVIRKADSNPVLHMLYWVLSLTSCLLISCPEAKQSLAEDNIATSLNRLWPWCMLSEEPRSAVVHLLLVFTNSCAKALGAMTFCVAGRNLIMEVCAMVTREVALQSRPRPDNSLVTCLTVLRQCVPHQQCRAVILKSDALTCINKLRINLTRCSGAVVAWARLCESLARHADGAAAVLAYRHVVASSPQPAREILTSAIAHATHHHRNLCLQSSELLELLEGTLLSGDLSEIVSAARAVWALAANNHKAKLILRSAGIPSAVQSAMNHVRASTGNCAARAYQLLAYTNTVLKSS